MIADDCELIDYTLEHLQDTNAGLHNVVCEPAGLDESAQLLASRFSVVVQYRQSGAAIGA